MSSVKKTTALFLVILICVSFKADAIKRDTIGLFDLSYTLKTDLNNPEGLKKSWDDVHTVATLHGIVNRNSPRLYVFLIRNKNIDIDHYWWNKYREKGKWLSGRDTIVYTNIIDLIKAYRCFIKGAVVYASFPSPAFAPVINILSFIRGEFNLIRICNSTNIEIINTNKFDFEIKTRITGIRSAG
jgi:hypothetical protein